MDLLCFLHDLNIRRQMVNKYEKIQQEHPLVSFDVKFLFRTDRSNSEKELTSSSNKLINNEEIGDNIQKSRSKALCTKNVCSFLYVNDTFTVVKNGLLNVLSEFKGSIPFHAELRLFESFCHIF